MTEVTLFLMGFTCISTVFEIAMSGKKTKSDRIQRESKELNKK